MRRLRRNVPAASRMAAALADPAAVAEAEKHASHALRIILEGLLARERSHVDQLVRQLAEEREAGAAREVALAAQLREQTIQTNRWRERAETMLRLEEGEFRARCDLTAKVRARGFGFMAVEPDGFR